MTLSALLTVKRKLNKWFPERQILLRSGGEVRFVPLTRRLQVSFCLLILGLLIGSAFLGAGIVQSSLYSGDRQAISTISLRADPKQDLQGQLASLRDAARQAAAAAAEERQARDEVVQESEALKALVGHLNNRVGAGNRARAKLQRELAQSRTMAQKHALQRQQADQARKNAEERLQAMVKREGDAWPSLSLSHQLSVLEEPGLETQESLRYFSRAQLAQRLTNSEQRLEELRTAQYQLVARLEDRTQLGINDIENILNATGLDVATLLKRVHPSGARGGPFVELFQSSPDRLGILPEFGPAAGADQAGYDTPPLYQTTLLRLEQRLDHWEDLYALIERVPLISPVDHYHVTSKFGRRKDPFKKRWAQHSGIDLGGYPRQVVHATAPGRVSFAGWKGAYGNLVELDHGYGMRSRYGHLHSISVKEGQQVTFREKIGRLGNTGRSTGPHVHFEIRVDGKPVDPANFIEAGKHVFKN